MATQKKNATKVAFKTVSKKDTGNAPVKKANNSKAAPAKAVASKKPLPVKTAAKSAPAKSGAKSVAPKNSSAKKPVVATKKQAVPKKTAPAKKVAVDNKKQTKPTLKHSPAKNTAKTGATKAVPKNLAKEKKPIEKKTDAVAKKTAPAKVKEKKKTVAAAPKKPVSRNPDTELADQAQSLLDHKAQLKKALANTKAKKQKAKKAEKPFVMPKTSTEKSRKYEPDFTKSVLDASVNEYTGPTMRYNDNDLVEFRELISRKLETAKKELGYLQGLITRKDQMGGDDTDNRYMTMEDGGLSMEREQLSQMASRQITFIDHLEKAMMRIENKTYGICRVTGKLIDKARLRAVPHATLSIEAKMGIVK